MNNYEKLKRYGKKTITKEELVRMFSTSQDEVLYPFIQKLEQDGYLQPMNHSKTNGNRIYPIYLKYKITIPEETFEEELQEIEKLHPALQRGGYLRRKPTEYRQYKKQFQELDQYLFRRKDTPIPVSRKERSFEIFSEEKQLDQKTFCGILERLGLDQTDLAFYDTPEYCFNDFIPEKKEAMTLLVCENKDIWFNIRRRMFEDHASEIFETHIDGVVFGCGNKISQKDALTSYTAFMGGADVTYLYWGDIDRAGFNIYLSACRNNPRLNIQLFLPAYEEMLRLARDRKIPDSEDNREGMGDYSEIYQMIAEEYKDDLRISILANKRIPQEIIPYTHLRQIMR